MIRITLRPPRCWVLGHRIHHALTGAALLLVPNETVRLIAVALILSDLHDARVWLPDLLAAA